MTHLIVYDEIEKIDLFCKKQFGKQKEHLSMLMLCTHCAVEQVDDLEKSLFELVV